MRFVVSTDGLDEALLKLRLLAAKGKDLTPLLDELGEDEVTRVMLRFESGTAPNGVWWDELTSRDGQPLMDTGRLYNSIEAQVIGKHRLQVGTATDYAHFHQFGTEHIPARPFLGVSDDLLASIKELTHAYFAL
jgi:phage virion morphogenesis family